MKIVILGAGQVGRTAAHHLSREEANEVTVVDVDEERRTVVLGVDVPAVANLPERLPLVSHRTART